MWIVHELLVFGTRKEVGRFGTREEAVAWVEAIDPQWRIHSLGEYCSHGLWECSECPGFGPSEDDVW